jgi:hypothetical protein
MTRLPGRVPLTVGEKTTLTVQLAFTARLVPQLFVCEKSPVVLMLLMERAAVPVLLRVTLWAGLLVPTVLDPNVRLEVERVATGANPVPDRLALCGLPAALSVTVMVPVRVPVAAGANVTWIEQFAPGARVVPQVVVFEKSPVTLMPLMESVAPPVLVRVIVCAVLRVPTSCPANDSEVGDRTAICGIIATSVTFVLDCSVPLVPATLSV